VKNKKVMRNFKNYEIWIGSIELTDVIYDICEGFPKNELYQLGSQMERAVVSIPSNIAEGAGRRSDVEFAHFLDIALGSAYELETQLIIARRRKYISEELFLSTDESIMSLQKRIGSFIVTLTEKK
jgi:four helix bundle protein